MALDGATPTRVGPKPLNNAVSPSVCTMCLKQEKMPAGLSIEISTGILHTPEAVVVGQKIGLNVGTDD